jgi:hypothetical protein
MRSLPVPGLVALAVLALVAVPAAASAHPADSEPQTMVISADGTDVTITWDAATDELGVLADVIGLGDGGEFLVFEDGELDQEASSKSPEKKLAAAPDVVESYFDDHVIVTTAGERCRGELQPIGDEVSAGITVVYHCGADVSSATVHADTLMGVDPRYVIAASANDENRLYRDDAREFTWTFDTAPRDAAQADAEEVDHTGTILYGSAAALGLLALVGYLWRRRRARAAKP